VNVLQTDTDVAWLASPYPLLKTHFANHSLVVQIDAPLVNAGVIYVQNAREGSGAAWLLQELARRVHLFMWHPEAVAEVVPWAKPPFFANADEQTIMNDVLISSIADEVTYAGSTAHWEIKRGSSKSVKWDTTREKHQYDAMMRTVEKARRPLHSSAATEQQLAATLCPLWRKRSQLGDWFPLHVASTPNRTAVPTSYAAAPNWMFAHYPADAGAWQASGHSAEQGPLCVPPTPTVMQQQQQQGGEAAAADRRPPFVMMHMAGIRTGAWHRRALLRAHGWWHPEADALMAAEAGWDTQRPLLRVAWDDGAAGTLPALSPVELETLVANLLTLSLLSERSAVVPDTECPAPGSAVAKQWKAFGGGVPRLARIHQGGVGSSLPAERCSWTPPVADGCLRLQFVTAAEHAAARRGAPPPARAEMERCAAAATAPASRSLPAAAQAKLNNGVEHRGRALQSFQRGAALAAALLPGGAADAADPMLAPLLRLLECHAHAPELVLSPALLAPLGTSPRDLAARPLLRHPALAISDAGASKQDVQDATCIEELLTPGPAAAAAAAAAY
jgi:hypothetical protein